jgi:hypothetical protein
VLSHPERDHQRSTVAAMSSLMLRAAARVSQPMLRQAKIAGQCPASHRLERESTPASAAEESSARWKTCGTSDAMPGEGL